MHPLALAAWSALAAPGAFEIDLREPLRGPISPEEADLLLEEAAGLSPDDAVTVRVFATDADGVRRPLRDFVPALPPVPDKDVQRRAMPVDHPGPGSGWLSGRAVYLSQCHGLIWFDSLGRFSTQRGNLFSTAEDFHNPEGMNQYLTAYLENAGASVFTTRERDMNPLMAIADNDGVGYAESGPGFEGGGPGFADTAPYDFGENPFRQGSTRRFPAAQGGVATWTPDVPADGWYVVYVSWDSDPQNATDAHYRITHPGGVIDRYFDQTVHGSTWQYLETLWLPEGTDGLTVELVGDSTQTGRWLSADAVRVGGGMGDVRRHGKTTGRPRWESSAVHYNQFNGAPASIYDPFGNGNGTDPTTRSRWAAWEHPVGEDAVYLSWHSNAGGGRGTSTYTWDGAETPGSQELGDLVHDEIVGAARALWDGSWTDRGRRYAQFAEVNPNHNPEIPSALVELAFHDSEDDILYLKHPEFRRDASRAMYRGIVRYFAERDGVTPHFLPEPPENVAVVHDDDGRVRVSWEPGPTGDPFGDAPTGYVVSTSTDGRSWGEGQAVSGTSTVLDVPRGEHVYVRVAAVNDGGTSFPSEVVGASRTGDGSRPPVLVVSAFDRLDRGTLVRTATSIGEVDRMDLRRMNAYDTAVAHGEAVRAAGWPFDTVSDEAFDSLDLDGYRLVIWIAGEESTADETFSDAQQQRLRDFVDAGGALWASGAEILWDLDYRGSASDKAFAADVLGAALQDDASGTTEVDGVGLLDGVGPLDFGLDAGAPYPVEWPDTLASDREVIARYQGGAVAAVLGDGVSLWGFPFEAVGDPDARAQVATRLLPALVPDYVPPDVDPEDPSDPGDPTAPDDTRSQGLTRARVGGCGCSGAPGSTPGLLVVLAAVVGVVRRRAR